jgi:hypothetical protein
MAFPTANVRVETRPPGFFAKSCHFNTTLESGYQWAANLAAQLHEFAGIRPIYRRDWTGSAQIAGPKCSEQAALLVVSATVVVAVEIFTFRSSRCFHSAISELPQFLSAGGFDYTRVRYSPVRVSTRMVSPTLTKFGHCTSNPVSTLTLLVTPVAVSPRTATSA